MPKHVQGQLLSFLFAVLSLTAAGILLLLPAAQSLGALRWLLGIPLIIVGIIDICFIPRFTREALPPDSDFRPFDPQGLPATGSEHLHVMASVLFAQLSGTPHQVDLSTTALRVSYDSGTVVRPGAVPRRRFRRQVTLVPTSDPLEFTRLDQTAVTAGGTGWSQVSTTSGLSWGGNARVTVGEPGSLQITSTKAVTEGLKAACQATGARLVMPTEALVAIANAGLGVIFALVAGLGAAFLPL